jgi:D-alanyl-D-alanine carboxypeptidase
MVRTGPTVSRGIVAPSASTRLRTVPLVRRLLIVAVLALAFGAGALVAALLPDRAPGPATGASAPPAGLVVASGAASAPQETPASVPTASPSAEPSLPLPSPSLPAIDRPGLRERLQGALDRDREELAAPGIAAAVLFPDGRIWVGTSGVADLKSGRPLTGDTPFPVASISKTFLAAEMMALVGEGRVDLEAPVAGLLPRVVLGGRPIDARITVRELLDHTSGLRDYLVDATLDKATRANPTKVWTPAMALAYVGKPLAQPGAGYHYANTNYVLLGLIAERVTGRTLAQEYRARFLDPLGLRSAFYQGAEKPTTELPTAYRYSSSALEAQPAVVNDGTPIRPYTSITTAAGAAGSMAASAPDLVRWASALYGGSLLPPATVQAMVDDAARTATLKPAASYGLGVQVVTVDGRLSYGHTGRLVGARSVLRWFPEDRMAIAVVTNESRFEPGLVLRDLLAIVVPQWPRGVPRPV